MKRFLLLFNAILCFSVILNAQTIDVMLDGAAFSMISPSGQYIAGNIDDKAVYYNSATGYATSLEGENLDDGGCFVWDINDKGQVAVDWKGQAAIWTEEEGYQVLVMPEGLEGNYSAARCITADGKTIVVSIGSPTSSIYLYTLNADGVWEMTALPMPTDDPIFHQNPQFIAPMGINDAATRIMGRYRIDTGLEELPFTWEKDAGGNWNVHWSAMEFICKGGKTDAVYPGELEFDGSEFDIESGEWQEEYNKAEAEHEQKWLDYEEAIRSLATGYYYSGKGSLSGIRMSKNGKYANVQISHEQTGSSYPAVIDLDNDTVYVFTCRPGAGCLSVTNDGTVSIQGVMDYFSWTYVSSINDVTSSQTLTDYTLQRTNGALNLAEYMTYETPDGPQVAEGTATLSSSGNGFVSWQYNGFGDNMRYETFIVLYGDITSTKLTIDDTLISYPNPTNGILYLSQNLSDIQLFDITGRCIYSASHITNAIDITHLPQGIYTLLANDGEKQIINKIVKK